MTTSATSCEPCQVSVIVPTYREAENLPVLVPRISAAFKTMGLRGEIIIVDDNSPDSTEQVCAELAETHPVRLLIRKDQRGLSSAVVHGLRQASGAILVVMDADLSHPPEKIPELVDALGKADFVIGSRYVAGAAMDEKWGLFRWLNSRVATLMAWPLTPARDPMSGFFALRSSTFNSAAGLDPVGYKIGLELMVKCGCRGIEEVPIFFGERLHGRSKLSAREQINYLRHLTRLYRYRLGALAQPMLFVLVGLTGMFVDLTIFSLLLSAMTVLVARAVAIWAAMSWNFWLNRQLTFSRARTRPILHQYLLFCLSCLLGAAVSWSTFASLYTSLAYFAERPLIPAFLGIIAGTGLNYAMSKYFVFR